MRLARPFIQLPFRFDAEQLSSDVGQFADAQWMAHPNRIQGNSAVPLVSLNGEDNDDFSGRMAPTPHLARCEYTHQVMASFAEVIARSRFMKLAAGAEVSPHVDFNYHWYSRVRIHIPVITNPEVIFHCGDDQVHMRAGECWLFDSWRWHKVINGSAHDRTHLVIDTAGSSRFWRLVRELEQSDPIGDDALELIPFQPGVARELRTEQFNVAPVMAPGEMEAIVRELIADFSANPDNDPAIVDEYRDILLDLARDWRQNWLLFGYQKDGWRHYKTLLDGTLSKLHPQPRALVTSSNHVGVNPIIVQRLLRAALHVDQMPAFR